MTYKETIEYLYRNLPMFQRVGAAAYKVDLYNTVNLMAVVDNPHTRFKPIHVAGTNGKGSSSHMLASILQEAGYKVGLYTSPHLKSFTERIRINGETINEKNVIDFVAKISPFIAKIEPSFFEITVAMAFDYFANQKVDIAVVEVGLGGRLDSTNIITPEVSLITNIGFDHQGLLGNSLAEIAFEKAGIIKQNVPVVISQFQTATATIFKKKASEQQAPIIFASDNYYLERANTERFNVIKGDEIVIEGLKPDLIGDYQQFNIPGVLQTMELLKNIEVDQRLLRAGLENVVFNTGLKGRWQVLSRKPTVICDTGHNKDAIKMIVNQLATYSYDKLHIVFGTVNDKSIKEVFDLLPKKAIYYFCQADIPRAIDAKELKNIALGVGLTGESYNSVNLAIAAAKAKAKEQDLIFIGGSTFIVAEIEDL